jgi:DMSO reductase anchor subunit
MNPAFSVILLTTLIGAGQGLLVAIYIAQWSERHGFVAAAVPPGYVVAGCVVSIALTTAGLVASFFHLGRPERAWRSAACWRTSWLSREVIALPAFIVTTALYAAAVHTGFDSPLVAGAPAAIACVALFVCTGMVYASIRFLQEWASALTPINFALIGLASGATVATALSSSLAPELFRFHATAAAGLTALALVSRVASLARNARLKPKSTLQSAIGIRHPRIVQIAQGFIGGSFNTREFFHGASAVAFRSIKWIAIALGFALPIVVLLAALALSVPALAWAAVVVQSAGLIAERWFFLAQANHPQNLYYQAIA